ncbi:MAG: amidohydrolase family protein [Bifidobacteriaceae bacterium]|jgi:predicted TIM-barrel fold metal-dependent hydrolase|nr:amidohydrolase family protein [Bifidobacteriaceae bacterium]
MLVDGLVFVGTCRFGYELLPDAALAALDAVGMEKAIASPVHPVEGPMSSANDRLLAAAQAAGGRLVPLCRIDPWDRDAPGEVARCQALGAKGVLLHPSEEHFRVADRRVKPIMQAAAALRLPVTIVAGFHLVAEPLQLGQAASWAEAVPVLLTTGGQLNISGLSLIDAKYAMAANPNLHLHSTGQYRQDFLEEVVGEYGANRLLYASAAPVFEMAMERARVGLTHLTQDELAQVLGGNAARLYGL